jgi:hypothetical protein
MYLAIEGGGEREERERESEIVSWIWNSFSFSVSHWRLLTPSRHRESHQCEVSQGAGHRAWEFLGCGSHGQRPTDGAHWDLGQEFRLDIFWMSFILWNRFGILDAIPLPLSRRLCFGGSVAASSKSQTCRLEYWSNILYIYIYLCVLCIYAYTMQIQISIYIYIIYIY